MSDFEFVAHFITGRIAMEAAEAALVEKYAALCDTWIEIGTLWGGSAILAALANPKLTIHCIDPMDGYYGAEDAWSDNMLPSTAALRDNFELFGVAECITLIMAKSDPFPDISADGILVDGAHDYDSVCKDVRAACEHSRRFILCHDTNDKPVDKAVNDAMDWKQWKLAEQSESMKVYCHV